MIEETGCNKEEAKHYLEESQGNITLALKNLLKNIRPIGVLKSRFKIDEVNIYGLLFFIFNGRTRKMLRYAAVTGCNPIIYETDIRSQWFSFERRLYSQRLKDGSLREITQKIEQLLLLKIQEQNIDEFYNLWNELNIGDISGMFRGQIGDVVRYDRGREYEISVETEWQKLNLRQFKYLTDTEKIDEEFKLHLDEEKTYRSLIVLKTDLVSSRKGNPSTRVEKIESGDMVYTKITDKRDIGVYLAYLLGARKGDKLIPFSASVEDVKDIGEGVELIVRFGPGIVGRIVENSKRRVFILKNSITRTFHWWYIIIVFFVAIVYYTILIRR